MVQALEEYRQKYAEAFAHVLRRPEVDGSVLRDVQTVVPFPFIELAHEAAESSVQELPKTQLEVFGRVLLAMDPGLRGRLFDFLTPADELAGPGVILAYGAAGGGRARQAAGVYSREKGPVVVTDAAPDVQQRFGEVLLERGVAAEDIWRENKARNYLENAYYSMKLISERDMQPERLYVVTESLAALRGVLATRCFSPEGVDVLSTPLVRDAENPGTDPTTPDNWSTTGTGQRMCLREILKLHLFDELELIRLV